MTPPTNPPPATAAGPATLVPELDPAAIGTLVAGGVADMLDPLAAAPPLTPAGMPGGWPFAPHASPQPPLPPEVAVPLGSVPVDDDPALFPD